MTKQPREALKSLASIPSNGFDYSTTAIALFPEAPLIVIAETKSSSYTKSYTLRISNYKTSEVVTQISIPFKIDKFSFSPDGKYLLASPINKKNPLFFKDYLKDYLKDHFANINFESSSSKYFWNIYISFKKYIFSNEGKRTAEYYGYAKKFISHSIDKKHYEGEYKININNNIYNPKKWSNLLVFTELCNSPTLKHCIDPFFVTLHSNWLDEKTVILAGTVEYDAPCIVLFDIKTGTKKIVFQEEIQPEGFNVYSAYCSSSGIVAFEVSVQGKFDLYKLNDQRNAVIKLEFNCSGINDIEILENGQIICLQNNKNTVVHYNSRLDKLNEFNIKGYYDHIKAFKYDYGIACLLSNSYTSQLYFIRNNKICQWVDDKNSRKFNSQINDFQVKGETILFAVSKKKGYNQYKTEVFELVDINILELGSENHKEKIEAIENLGDRRFQPAVTNLIQLIYDDDLDVKKAAIKALADIGDATALPQLIRALGHKSGDRIQSDLLSALKKFPLTELSPEIFNCLDRPVVTYRRGAVRALQYMPSIEALKELCTVINDADKQIRLAASDALRKRKDLRACVALLGLLNEEEEEIRNSVYQAITEILNINGLLAGKIDPDYYWQQLPLDITNYAHEVISKGRMEQFEHFENSSAGEFLTGLASACIDNKKPVPQILNSIDALTIRQPGDIIGLTMAVICANTIRKQNRWREAAHVYRNAITIARQVEAPQIEWRSWYAVGECLEKLGNDPKAMIAFRNAMDVIDCLWFALLEEDKLQDFFQDKAQLYDRAELCYLRLGHKALALECREKSKTRYLGDLIARRQMNPQVALAQELQEFWKNIGDAHPVRASLGSSPSMKKEKVEIVAVEWGIIEAGANSVQVEQLAALEDACQTNKDLKRWLERVRDIWQLVSYISTAEDESFRELLEDIYQALLPIYQAAKAESLPISTVEKEECLNQFKQAASALKEAGRGIEEAEFWLFSEFNNFFSRCFEKICTATEPPEETLLLNAMIEAFNSVLHHEPIIGIPSESLEEDQEGLIFSTRTLKDSKSLNQKTTIIESSLERYSRSKWRYITQIARGQIANFRDIADDLNNQPQTAQIEFSVTKEGTVVYVTHGVGTPTLQKGLFPTNLKGKDGLEIFTYPKVTLASLRDLLLENNDSWITQYREKEDQAWKDAMEKNLKELYTQLIKLIQVHLQELNVKHLRIIPNRTLNLIPFGALYYEDNDGKRHYLIDEYTISYAPSATLQQICRKRATNLTQKQKLTAISNPTLDLFFASFEVETISTLFSVSEILKEEKATLTQVQQLSPNSFFHFACHGNYEWLEPLESALSLANSEYLNLGSLFEESINLPETMIAVLSACETGISSPTDLADEYIGLAAGFLFSGVPWCVSSLWRVDEISTAFLMINFYQNLDRGNSVAVALNQAQTWLRDVTKIELQQWIDKGSKLPLNPTVNMSLRRRLHKLPDDACPFQDPYYWAAFCAIGQ